MNPNVSTIYDAYVPVYDAIPESWEEGRQFLVERLKEHANAINIREIGWLLDEEYLSGQQVYPGTTNPNDQTFRSVLKKVIDSGPLTGGANTFAHGITVDINFTLIDMWCSATNSTTFESITMSDPQNIVLQGPNVIVTSPGVFDRSNIVISYIQEM